MQRDNLNPALSLIPIKRKIFFPLGKIANKAAKGLPSLFWLWQGSHIRGDSGDAPGDSQQPYIPECSSSTSSSARVRAEAAASTAHQGEENPADRIRQAQMFSAKKNSHFQCVLNGTFKRNFLCQWTSPQIFFLFKLLWPSWVSTEQELGEN